MKKKQKMEPVMADSKPMSHAHLESDEKAPKLHVGQKVTAMVTGTVKEVAEGYSGEGHRTRIEPDKITYSKANPDNLHKVKGFEFLDKKRK